MIPSNKCGYGFYIMYALYWKNSRSVQPKGLFHKVNGFNRGHFLLFILAVNLFVNFQRWWAPGVPMNIHGKTQEWDLIWHTDPHLHGPRKPGWENKVDPLTPGPEPYHHPPLQLNQPERETAIPAGPSPAGRWGYGKAFPSPSLRSVAVWDVRPWINLDRDV